jgi:hypothetical protein
MINATQITVTQIWRLKTVQHKEYTIFAILITVPQTLNLSLKTERQNVQRQMLNATQITETQTWRLKSERHKELTYSNTMNM